MTVNLEPLNEQKRLLFDIPLKPVQGERFQPTGFPNLGAATYTARRGQCLLVESAQSMANRLEATIWDKGTNAVVSPLSGLSYVIVVDAEGKFLTSSILEAHRLNSVYIEVANDGKFKEELTRSCNYDEKAPIDRAAFLQTMLCYDVNSLLHGAFLESIGGRLRVARAMSSFIEAEGVRVAPSGGVKNDHVTPGKEEGKDAAAGYGNVPFSRDEYTAERLTLYANIDLAQIRGYGLGAAPTKMLTLLSLYKLRSLLDGDLRLRTACDLVVATDQPVAATNVDGWTLATQHELLAELTKAVAAVDKMKTSKVIYAGPRKKAAKGTQDESQTPDQG
jgi:CRISPR-associated protein Csb1